MNGFFSIHLREESAVAGLLYGDPPLPRLEEFLGVAIASILPRSRLIGKPEPISCLGPPSASSRFSWMTPATLAALARPDFAPRAVVYLPVDAREEVSAKADPSARIVSSVVTAEKCAFQTEADTRTMLVMAQGWYHCWQASVDGIGVPLLRANGGFQAVEVPDGSHQVLFEYKDRAFQIGCAISLVALLFCAVTIASKNE